MDPKALLDGWRRYARADVDAAVARYPELVQARGLDAGAASPFAIAVGLRLALSRDPRALDFFALGQASDFDEQAHEWHARAALWAGDWARARKAIDAMPEALRNQNRWKYWSARAAEQLGDSAAAKQGYAAVMPTDNWYAVLSAARLGKQFAPTFKPAGVSDAGMDRLAAEAPFVRARELALCDMQTEAHRRMACGLRRARAGRADPGHRARGALDLVSAGNFCGCQARGLRRLRPALPASVRHGSAPGLVAERLCRPT